MFPEGTRRKKGLVKRFEARPRSGAARIALEAGVPLVPAALKGTDKLLRLGKLSVAYGPPVDIDDLRGGAWHWCHPEAMEEGFQRVAARFKALRSMEADKDRVRIGAEAPSQAQVQIHGNSRLV
jgi:1-acyl-sn-glycerol-3-phosphate acyltransferase